MVAEAPAQGREGHPDLVRLRSRPRSELADAVAVVLDPSMVLFAGPLALLEVCVRRGWVSDPQVARREERLKPLGLVMVLVLAGLALLRLLDAPAVLVAFVASVLVGLAVMTALTVSCKASFHTGVLGAMGAMVAVEVGWWTVSITFPLLTLLGWARWRAGRHSAAQVVVGAALCALVVGGSFALMR